MLRKLGGMYRQARRSARYNENIYTGVLIIENALSLFHTQYLARRNYSAEMTEILGHSAWDSRGIFAISVWGPRYGVPLGSWGGPKILEIFFFTFSFISIGMGSESFNSLVYAKISPSFNHFNVLTGARKVGSLKRSVVFEKSTLKNFLS